MTASLSNMSNIVLNDYSVCISEINDSNFTGTGRNDYKYPVTTYTCYSYSVTGLA